MGRRGRARSGQRQAVTRQPLAEPLLPSLKPAAQAPRPSTRPDPLLPRSSTPAHSTGPPVNDNSRAGTRSPRPRARALPARTPHQVQSAIPCGSPPAFVAEPPLDARYSRSERRRRAATRRGNWIWAADGPSGQDEEGCLKRVLRASISQDVSACSEYEWAIPPDEFCERVLVAVGRVSLKKFGVRQGRDVRGSGVLGEAEQSGSGGQGEPPSEVFYPVNVHHTTIRRADSGIPTDWPICLTRATPTP